MHKGLEIALSAQSPTPNSDLVSPSPRGLSLFPYVFIYSHLVPNDLQQLTEIQPNNNC